MESGECANLQEVNERKKEPSPFLRFLTAKCVADAPVFSDVHGQPILSQAVRELVAKVPLGHHANVLAKFTDPATRLYYLQATAYTRALCV